MSDDKELFNHFLDLKSQINIYIKTKNEMHKLLNEFSLISMLKERTEERFATGACAEDVKNSIVNLVRFELITPEETERKHIHDYELEFMEYIINELEILKQEIDAMQNINDIRDLLDRKERETKTESNIKAHEAGKIKIKIYEALRKIRVLDR